MRRRFPQGMCVCVPIKPERMRMRQRMSCRTPVGGAWILGWQCSDYIFWAARTHTPQFPWCERHAFAAVPKVFSTEQGARNSVSRRSSERREDWGYMINFWLKAPMPMPACDRFLLQLSACVHSVCVAGKLAQITFDIQLSLSWLPVKWNTERAISTYVI